MQNFNFNFHRRSTMVFNAELNNHTLFFLIWQKPKDEGFICSRCAETQISEKVPLIQDARWIVKLCACMCVYVVLNSVLPTEQTVNHSECFFPSFAAILPFCPSQTSPSGILSRQRFLKLKHSAFFYHLGLPKAKISGILPFLFGLIKHW